MFLMFIPLSQNATQNTLVKTVRRRVFAASDVVIRYLENVNVLLESKGLTVPKTADQARTVSTVKERVIVKMVNLVIQLTVHATVHQDSKMITANSSKLPPSVSW